MLKNVCVFVCVYMYTHTHTHTYTLVLKYCIMHILCSDAVHV